MSFAQARAGFLPRLFLLPGLMLAPLLQAADLDFAGFASLVYGKTITDDRRQQDLYGMSNDGNYREMSLLGLRVDAGLLDNVSFTAQMVAYGKDDFDPGFDWAYATIGLAPGLNVSVGRTRIPLFMYSSYQDVAYAYPWIKPPFSVYGIPQFKSVDGGQLQYQANMGEWISNLQLWMGSTSERLTENGLDADLELDNNMGVAWTVERDWLTLRGVYMQADSAIDLTSNPDLAALDGGLNLLIATAAGAGDADSVLLLSALQDSINWENNESRYYGLGAGVDFGDWFAVTEATRIELQETIAAGESLESFYVTVGTRIVTDWTFSFTITRDIDREHESLIDQYANTLAVLYAGTPLQQALAAGLDASLSSAEFEAVAKNLQRFDSTGYTASVRWDFHKSAALKFEYLRHTREYGGDGKVFKPQAARIGLDLVF